MRIVFLGTPEFGVTVLKALLESRHEIIGVITRPDAPCGRGKQLVAPPVKQFAKEHKLKVFQFEKLSRDGVETIQKLNPDLMVTASFGQIISKEILDIPPYGILNVHASILPKFRGASPIQTAIMKGESVTGVTIMKTELGLDTGDIYSIKTTPINPYETAGELSKRLADIGAKLLLETIDEIEYKGLQPQPQSHVQATITKKITKEDVRIRWVKSDNEIKNLIYGANPSPIAYTETEDGTLVKIYEAKLTNLPNTQEPEGTIVAPTSNKKGVFVQCGQGVLQLTKLQFAGGKEMDGASAINGNKLKLGQKFVSAY